MKVVHCKKEPYDVYIGRPSKTLRFEIFGEPSEAFRVVVQHSDSRVAPFTKSASILSGKVVVIPTQIDGGSTPTTSFFENDLSTFSVSTFVKFGTFISVFAASPSTAFAATTANVNGSAMRADSRPLFCINLGQPVQPTSGLRPGNEYALAQEAVIASDAKPSRPEWFVTTLSGTEIKAFRSRDGSHNMHYTEPFVHEPFIWGNPFIIGRDGDRAAVIEKYRQRILNSPSLLANVHTLRGRVLGCWCKPAACHGDVLVELANK